jgi:WhiB family redox-sensing transcriptional regulator
LVLRLREDSPNLWDGAKCLSVTVTGDYDPFFDDEEMDEAISFCNGESDGIVCPIREKCLHFALTNNEKFGVWGGTSELTRKALRKKLPSKGGKPNSGWKWMSEEDALDGLDRERLKRELDEEKKYQA